MNKNSNNIHRIFSLSLAEWKILFCTEYKRLNLPISFSLQASYKNHHLLPLFVVYFTNLSWMASLKNIFSFPFLPLVLHHFFFFFFFFVVVPVNSVVLCCFSLGGIQKTKVEKCVWQAYYIIIIIKCNTFQVWHSHF